MKMVNDFDKHDFFSYTSEKSNSQFKIKLLYNLKNYYLSSSVRKK